MKRKGQAVAGAEIVFVSQSNPEEAVYYGISDPAGQYLLEGRGGNAVPPDKYQVTVTWFTQANGKPLPEGEAGEVLKHNGRAKKHEAKFERQVSGSGDIDLELTE